MKIRHRMLIFLVVAMVVALTGCDKQAPEATAVENATIAAVRADSRVIAEGRVVPVADVSLALLVGGRVARVDAAEGERVDAGQPLLHLDDAAQQAALAQAQAALDLAKAELERVQQGARVEEIGAAEAAVASALAQQAVAEAQAQNAEAGLKLYDGQVTQAEAALADIKAGATSQERKIAELQVELARNEVWAAESYRDGVVGAVDDGRAQEYDGDRAEAAVGTAWVAHEIAKADQERVTAPPRAGALAQAVAAVEISKAQRTQGEGQVQVARAQVDGAEAGVGQAVAQADLVKAGATAADLRRAEAGVRQAEAGVQAAQVALANLVLEAPRAGTLTNIHVDEGEFVSPGAAVAVLADLSAYEVLTQDLTEIEVVKVSAGQKVTVTPDALPSLELAGEVVSIDERYEEKRGDITYTARVRLLETDPRLRWGMTVVVSFAE